MLVMREVFIKALKAHRPECQSPLGLGVLGEDWPPLTLTCCARLFTNRRSRTTAAGALCSMWLERKTERETNLIGLSVIQ